MIWDVWNWGWNSETRNLLDLGSLKPVDSSLIGLNVRWTISPEPTLLDRLQFFPAGKFNDIIRAAIQDPGNIFGSESVTVLRHMGPPLEMRESQYSEGQAGQAPLYNTIPNDVFFGNKHCCEWSSWQSLTWWN